LQGKRWQFHEIIMKTYETKQAVMPRLSHSHSQHRPQRKMQGVLWKRIAVSLIKVFVRFHWDGRKGCDAIYICGLTPTFRRHILPLSSGWKRRPSNKLVRSRQNIQSRIQWNTLWRVLALVATYFLRGILVDLDIGRSTFLRNVGEFLTNYTASHCGSSIQIYICGNDRYCLHW
jgi:hypothetical protein